MLELSSRESGVPSDTARSWGKWNSCECVMGTESVLSIKVMVAEGTNSTGGLGCSKGSVFVAR